MDMGSPSWFSCSVRNSTTGSGGDPARKEFVRKWRKTATVAIGLPSSGGSNDRLQPWPRIVVFKGKQVKPRATEVGRTRRGSFYNFMTTTRVETAENF